MLDSQRLQPRVRGSVVSKLSAARLRMREVLTNRCSPVHFDGDPVKPPGRPMNQGGALIAEPSKASHPNIYG